MSDPEIRRGRGRPRRADADPTIISAATEALASLGFAAFTVDAVAARTGIAKTTIYRRWPTKSALVSAVTDDAIPLTGETIESLLDEIVAAMRLLGGRDARADPSSVAGIVEVLLPFIAARRPRLVALLPPLDADVVADALSGALLLRFVAGDRPIDPMHVRMLVRRIVHGGM